MSKSILIFDNFLLNSRVFKDIDFSISVGLDVRSHLLLIHRAAFFCTISILFVSVEFSTGSHTDSVYCIQVLADHKYDRMLVLLYDCFLLDFFIRIYNSYL